MVLNRTRGTHFLCHVLKIQLVDIAKLLAAANNICCDSFYHKKWKTGQSFYYTRVFFQSFVYHPCLRFLGRPDGPARSRVPRKDPAAETADWKWSVGQRGDGGQHHSAPRSLHTGTAQLRPAAAGGRSPGGKKTSIVLPLSNRGQTLEKKIAN